MPRQADGELSVRRPDGLPGQNNTVQINRPLTDRNSFDFHMEANGKPTNKRVAAPAITFYLRITKQGDSCTGDYSLDGEA